MLRGVLKAILRVLAGTIFILALAATIGIPAGKRGPAAAQPGDASGEPLLGSDLYCPLPSIAGLELHPAQNVRSTIGDGDQLGTTP